MVQSLKKNCRPRNLLALIIIIVICINIYVIFKHLSPECPKSWSPVKEIFIQKYGNQNVDFRKILQHKELGQWINDDGFIFPQIDLNLGRWDKSLHYKMYDNIIIGGQYKFLNKVFQTCMATQSSLDRLSSIVEVAKNWNGPISLAVFAAGEDELNNLLLYIAYLRKCDPNVRQKIAFHLLMDIFGLPKVFNMDWNHLNKMNCTDVSVFKKIVDKMNKKMNENRTKLAYPQNHLRNLARKNCQTKYVFVTDVDIVPSKGMAEELEEFLGTVKCEGKCAYVIPTYELDAQVQFPLNKCELIRLAKKRLARPFHFKVFIQNQFATNFSRWESSVNEEEKVHISHLVTKYELFYEPFYVALNDVPAYDERFVGYGYTRNSQVYEMFMAGYSFHVLSPIFTCHWGFQTRKARPSWREGQNYSNGKRFKMFKAEVLVKYHKNSLNVTKKTNNLKMNSTGNVLTSTDLYNKSVT